MTRREFLRLLGSAGIAMPALIGQSGCSPALTRTDTTTGLSLCYVAGDVTPDGAMVWLRAEPNSQVFLQYSKEPSLFCCSGDTRESYKPFTVMNAVRAQHPDFFLHLGDTIYADRGGTAHQLAEFWAKYRANRDDAATQLCFGETSTYVTWDDHEVADDYLPGNPLAPIGRRAFLDYWPIRRNLEEPERIYRSFRWGKALELFILDTRQYRDRKHGTMLGKSQKEWLFEGISRSEAIFKFIATSVPMAGGGSDRWDGYPRERAEILGYIRGEKISGVIFLSADLHSAAITRIPKSSGLRDITAGPLAAPLNRITSGTASQYEFFLAENFNFAKITVDPKAGPVHALVEFIDQDNRLFYSTKIKPA